MSELQDLSSLVRSNTPLITRILTGLRGTRPLSVLMAEQVEGLREWAKTRTVPAD